MHTYNRCTAFEERDRIQVYVDGVLSALLGRGAGWGLGSYSSYKATSPGAANLSLGLEAKMVVNACLVLILGLGWTKTHFLSGGLFEWRLRA